MGILQLYHSLLVSWKIFEAEKKLTHVITCPGYGINAAIWKANFTCFALEMLSMFEKKKSIKPGIKFFFIDSFWFVSCIVTYC